MALDLSALSTKEAVTAIFVGYYDRAPAPNGLNYWVDDIEERGFSLADVARAFAGQPESQTLYPELGTSGAMDLEGNVAFVTAIFQNLFGRDPNNISTNGGADNFWVNELQNGADVGQLILDIMSGAQGDDREILTNKIEVGVAYSDASEAAGTLTRLPAGDTILDNVTADDASVAAAQATIDDLFEGETPSVPGAEFFLSSKTDAGSDFVGTDNDDTYYAYIAQNEFSGGISNTLSSADRLDGGAGNDRLYAELSKEFLGVSGVNTQATDIQPRIKNIEEIDIEARDDTQEGPNADDTIIVDAKHITDHVEIGSFYSDGDLVIENLTTLTSAGNARNTADITVTMDHTDNFNSDGDASDLTVLFDNDYLLTDQTSVGQAFFFLLDQDAELRLQNSGAAEGRLDEIDKNGIRFQIAGVNYEVTFDEALLEENNPAEVNSHAAFVAALQADLTAQIAAGTVPAGTTITLTEFEETLFDNQGLPLNRAGLQNATLSDLIPAITVTSGDGAAVTPLGFSAPDEITGEFNVFGRFSQDLQTDTNPISVDIDLEKAGRGGEGGDLIIGGKSENTNDNPNSDDFIADGIEVFNITVKGAAANDPSGMSKPSNVGTITSTGNELKTVNIVSEARPEGSTFASLTVRNGFDQSTTSNIESGDLQLVNANGFFGNLTLGDLGAANNAGRITNLDTLNALGGGDVTFAGLLDGTETAQDYTYNTGAGNDVVDLLIDGDAVDYQDSSVRVETGGGNDTVLIDFVLDDAEENQQLNQTILDNVTVNTGAGDDVVDVDNVGNANILAGSGNDVIYTDGSAPGIPAVEDDPATTEDESADAIPAANAVWAFNHDELRDPLGTAPNAPAEDLPGEPLSLAYLSGAVITVTLSGAGVGGDYTAGGGLMSVGADGAVRLDDGYEANATITSLINGNEHYGDQRDVNAAVIRAIEGDSVLNNLLSVSVGANNTLVVTSKTSGNFDATDLRIDILQETYTSPANANSVRDEARSLFNDSGIQTSDLFAGTAAGSVYTSNLGEYGADMTGDNPDAWYDGLSSRGGTNQADDNLHTAGQASISETDNTIDGGAGNDLIVLSTDGIAGTVPAFTFSAETALLNGASNETVVMTGTNFGDDTVMNFTANSEEAGLDFLDFSAYLTSQTDVSGPGGSADSYVPITVTLDDTSTNADANEVMIVEFDPTTGASWNNLGASQVSALFNNTASTSDYDGLAAASFTVTDGTSAEAVVGGISKAVVMFENADNDGEYKVFELTWDSSAPAGPSAPTVAVTDLGSLDFGDTLDYADDAFLVGSAGYDALFEPMMTMGA